MRIEELHLKNFRCFKELDIQFPKSNLAVFIGLNGAGKSAILDAIKIMLSADDDFMKEMLLLDSDINIEENGVKVSAKVDVDLFSISWKLSKSKNTTHIHRFVTEVTDEHNKITGDDIELQKYYIKCNGFFRNVYHYKTTRKNDFEKFKKWFMFEKAKESNEREENRDYNNPNLITIKKAIENFCGYVSNMSKPILKVKYTQNNTDIIVAWDDKNLNLSQLSDGQRNLLLLVTDIAFSLINDEVDDENTSDILKGNGIILIDEIELHLHPQWQREVLPALQKTFPNIQFIVTTHSPQVLSNLKKEEVFVLKDNKIVEVTPHIEGRDSNSILSELFGVEERPEYYKEKLEKFYALLEDNEQREQAKEILAKLTEAFGEQDSEIVRANLYLDFASE